MAGLCSLRKKSLRVIWNDHVTDSASNYYPYGRSWDAYYKIFTVYSISHRKTYTKIHTISRKGSPLGSFRTSCSILSEKYRYYRRKSRFAGVYFHCIYHLPPFMEKKYTALNCSRNDLLYAASVCILRYHWMNCQVQAFGWIFYYIQCIYSQSVSSPLPQQGS